MWIVARTKGGREAWAAENLARQNFNFYFPRIIDVVKRAGLKMTVAKPLFPTYMFVAVDAHAWRPILSTYGVIGVIMRGGVPEIMPKHGIDSLRERENREGFVSLPDTWRFKKDQRVRIEKGILAGQVGIVAGLKDRDRVRVLFEFLGRKTEVLIAETDLIEVAA
jgi:transcriptional antiterminator RfaH